MEQADFPPQIGVSLAGRNVIKVSHKIKKNSLTSYRLKSSNCNSDCLLTSENHTFLLKKYILKG